MTQSGEAEGRCRELNNQERLRAGAGN